MRVVKNAVAANYVSELLNRISNLSYYDGWGYLQKVRPESDVITYCYCNEINRSDRVAGSIDLEEIL
jgi:hypothetical protein